VIVVAIDSARCCDPRSVGAKAASLARARRAGLPVPDSVVVPCAASAAVLDAARHCAAERGLHAGRLEVMTADRAALADLPGLAGRLGPTLAVRSSALREDDPRLAGAFSSLIGVRPAEVPTAVLAVWASAILDHPDPARPAGGPRMGVLIQPELAPSFAGAAHVLADESVEVVMTSGPAAPLMAGWEPGVTVTVGPAGEIAPDDLADDPGGLHDLGGSAAVTAARAAAGLAQQAASRLGLNLIEWAVCGGMIWLVQCRQVLCPAESAPAGRASHGQAAVPAPARYPVASPSLLTSSAAAPAITGAAIDAAAGYRAVLRAARYAGALGERWVLPWVVGWDGLLPVVEAPAAQPDDNPLQAWRLFQDLSARLTAQAWDPRIGPLPAAGSLAEQLRAGRPPTCGPRRPGQPEPALVARFGQVVERLVSHLRAQRVIASAREFWALPDDLGPFLRGARPGGDGYMRSVRAAVSWEPSLFAAVVALGQSLAGRPMAAGAGCGPAVLASEATAAAPCRDGGLPARSVIIAQYPLPRYAPLLMGAAALVTSGGGEGAHLVTVARSLGVPAVAGCDLRPLVRASPASVVAVDGAAGEVSVLAAVGSAWPG
jgi:phosphohistidine swiveling domain-containing protein